jgi:hypothetical protein
MTDRTGRADEDPDTMPDGPREPIRPIPDGGLGTAMPDWLQQPPAWKRPSTGTPTKTIPPPDLSAIDPREMLDLDDLPQWLQQIAHRGPGQERLAREPGALEEVESPPVPGPAAHVQERALESNEPSKSPVPYDFVEIRTKRSTTSWWMSDAVVGALFIAIILTIVYVVLMASNVL